MTSETFFNSEFGSVSPHSSVTVEADIDRPDLCLQSLAVLKALEKRW